MNDDDIVITDGIFAGLTYLEAIRLINKARYEKLKLEKIVEEYRAGRTSIEPKGQKKRKRRE